MVGNSALTRRPIRRFSFPGLAGIVGVLLLMSGIAVVFVSPSQRDPGTVFGVLQADAAFLESDTAAGLRLAMINIGWSDWQPEPGRESAAYVADVISSIERYRAARWQVVVDIGLQSPPLWVMRLPGALLVDQNGHQADVPAYEFSENVRTAADSYIASVVRQLKGVDYYRVGLSSSGEALYPAVIGDGWWAYSATAQGRAGGLPPGTTPTPLPGWVPGSPEYKGRRLTRQDVQVWYDWYFGAMVKALAWEIQTYRQSGFAGQLQLVMPGYGALPDTYSYRLNHDLAPDPHDDPYDTMNAAGVWWRLLDELPDLSGIVVDISSVYDLSGSPRGNVCTSSDRGVDYRSNPVVDTWSDTRWLAYLARKHHLPVVGENGGDNPPQDLDGVLRLVRRCHLGALQWAFEPELHDSGSSVNILQLATAIADYRS